MRSSSVKPTPRAHGTSSASTSGSTKNYGKVGSSVRSPSVPVTPKIVNKKYAHVKSRVNAVSDHTPQQSNIRIFDRPVKFNVTSKVGSLQNATHTPSGGNVRIENRKLNFKENAKPRIEARSDVPIPVSTKKIPQIKLEWKAEAKMGSMENAQHKPAGGNVKIFNQPPKLDAVQSKVGSLNNIGHVPGGGNVKISEHPSSSGGSVNSRRRNTTDSRSSSSVEVSPLPPRSRYDQGAKYNSTQHEDEHNDINYLPH